MINKKYLFSIIIPTYNSAIKLGRALDSISKQTIKDFEVIVCDDGSSDNTKDVVSSFSGRMDIKYVYSEHWGGPARPRNNGLKISRGEYIAFLDSDDWWYPEKLEIAAKYLQNADVVYHDLDVYTPTGKKTFKKVKGRHLRKPVFVDLMRNENALITSSVAVRKSIVERIGGMREEIGGLPLICFEDFDFWLRLAKITDRFFYAPGSFGAYWIEGNNVSRAAEGLVKRIEAVYNKHLDSLSPEDRKQAKTVMSYLIGRTKQRMGFLKEAISSFGVSLKSRNPKFMVRSICWIFFLSLLIGLRGKTGD